MSPLVPLGRSNIVSALELAAESCLYIMTGDELSVYNVHPTVRRFHWQHFNEVVGVTCRDAQLTHSISAIFRIPSPQSSTLKSLNGITMDLSLQ